MLKRLTLFIGISVLLFLGGCTTAPQSAPTEELPKLNLIPLESPGKGTIKLIEAKEELKGFGDNAPVLKIKSVDAKKRALELAKEFELDIMKEEISAGNIKVSGASGELVVSDNGGSFEYYRAGTSDEQGIVPGDEEAKQIAQQFLAKHMLLPENAKLKEILPEAVAAGNKTLVKNRDVFFQNYVGGIPIEKGLIRVRVGINGKVLAISHNVKQAETVGTYPLMTPMEAIDVAKSGKGVLLANNSWDKGTVFKVKLVYPDNGPFTRIYTQYQPVYVFEGFVQHQDGYDQFNLLVPAVKPEYWLETKPPVADFSKESGTEKEYAFKNPDKLMLVTGGKKTTVVAANPEISSLVKTLLQDTNGQISGFAANGKEIDHKFLTYSQNYLQLEYIKPAKISCQFGKQDPSFVVKDKYGNVAMEVTRLSISLDMDEQGRYGFAMLKGTESGLLVQFDPTQETTKLFEQLKTLAKG